MKPKFVTAAIIAIGAGAFLAGRSSVSSRPAEAAAETAKAVPAGSSRMSGGDGPRSSGANKGDGRSGVSSNERPATKEARLAKLETIMRGGDALARSRALLDYLDQLDPSELKDAVDRFRTMGITQERMGEYAMMLTAWAKADPTAALAYTKENTRGGFATNTILSSWATADPDAAIAWAKANHNGDEANPYMAGIIRGLASSDPSRATSLMTDMPMSQERGEALTGLLPYIMAQGPDATRTWIASITDEHLRSGAVDRAAESLAFRDPQGTADWLLSNPGGEAPRSMGNVISTWMEKDPAAAAAYYQSMPAGEARSNALRGVVNSMAIENPQAASTFMDSHPADVDDRVIGQFVWHSLEQDPALAITTISKMSDPDGRDGLYRRAIDNWIRTDQAAALSYLQSHPLPDTMQGYVRQKTQK